MKAVDTNVLVRFLTHDDPAHVPAAERLIRSGVFVPDTVLLELEWVLRGGLDLKRDDVCELLEALVRLRTLEFADRSVIEEAVSLHRHGLDFADALHAATAASHVRSLRTFDKAFVKNAKRAKSRIAVEGV